MASVAIKGLYETTYTNSYRACSVLPPLQYHQPPGFQHDDVPKLPPRFFPLIPRGPHRQNKTGTPLGLGLGTKELMTEKYLEKKPIVRTDPPKEIVNASPVSLLKRRKSAQERKSPLRKSRSKTPKKLLPLPNAANSLKIDPEGHKGGAQWDPAGSEKLTGPMLDKLLDGVTWTTTLQRATEHAKADLESRKIEPPMSTYEENSDMVKYRPAKYEPSRELWQEVGRAWDVVQVRPEIRPQAKPVPAKLKPSRFKFNRDTRSDQVDLNSSICQLAATAEFSASRMRPCPHYAGFIPCSPIQAPVKKHLVDLRKQSIMKASYRKFPVDEYRMREFAHKGPMSRTVTLKYPYNPFNKMEHQPA